MKREERSGLNVGQKAHEIISEEGSRGWGHSSYLTEWKIEHALMISRMDSYSQCYHCCPGFDPLHIFISALLI